MAINANTVNLLRHKALMAFGLLSNGRESMACTYYARNITENVYRDKEVDNTLSSPPIDTYCYIQLNAPIKVVKELSWFKEGDSLPILMYLPYQDDFVPEQGSKVVVPPSDSYMGDTWTINSVKAYGQDVPILWVCNVSPKRS